MKGLAQAKYDGSSARAVAPGARAVAHAPLSRVQQARSVMREALSGTEVALQRKQTAPTDDEEKRVQRKAKKDDEEKRVQRKAKKDDEEKRVQRKAKKDDEEKRIQRKAKKDDEEKRVQRAALDTRAALSRFGAQAQVAVSSPGDRHEAEADRVADRVVAGQAAPLISRLPGGAVTRSVASEFQPRNSLEAAASRALANKGAGRPLAPDTRSKLESSMGVDLSSVRVHDDARARSAAQSLNARAFTHGSDIWLGPGESQRDTHLMAHEATHVVQQQSGIAQRQVQRQTYNSAAGSIVFPSLPVPTDLDYLDRYRAQLPLIHHKDFTGNRVDTQRDSWRQGVAKDNSVSALRDAFRASPGNANTPEPSRFAFRVPSAFQVISGAAPRYLLGNLETCAEQALFPTWTFNATPAQDARARPEGYQVDHIVEQQVGALQERNPLAFKADVNQLNNYMLLRPVKNSLKKDRIQAAYRQQVTAFLENNTQQYGGKAFQDYGVNSILSRLSLRFDDVAAGASLGIVRDDYWRKEEVEAGTHLRQLIAQHQIRYVNLAEEEHQIHDPNVWLFPTSAGGIRTVFNKAHPSRSFLSPFVINSVQDTNLGPTELLKLQVNFPAEGRENSAGTRLYQPFPTDKEVTIHKLQGDDGSYFTKIGYIDDRSAEVSGLFTGAAYTKLSPIEVDGLRVEPGLGLVARGHIQPSIPLLNSGIDFELAGDSLRFYKTFTIGDLSVPPPFSVDDSSLTLSVGTAGLSIEGEISFSVRGLGHGTLRGEASTSDGFALTGSFDFDSRLFDRASVNLWYRNHQFGGGGEIGIDQPNKIRGVRSANVRVEFGEGRFSAIGTVEPSIRGVQQAGLTINYSEAEGLVIGGNLQLTNDVPGIRSGSVDVTLRKHEEEWKVTATGRAQPAIPGIDSELTVNYDDGAFTAEFNGSFRRGMLAGTANVGVTNRTLDAAGAPTGPPAPDAPLIVYGRGSATVRIAPWLQGTAGIEFAPNGEVTVSGEIGLPSQLEIFSLKQIERSLLNIAVQVPIVPGIVAEIGGNLTAQASVGPGVIDQLRIGITYNPAHEENTHVTGDAHLNIPAEAGLRLGVRAGIGLGIPGASATGGLEIGGFLGIGGAAEAGVHIDWTPSTGLSIDAFGAIHAAPKFRFDISGYVSVRALGFSVYDNRWQFAQLEYGSDLQFGVRFPIRYREGQPFDISLSDVEFTVPDVNPRELLHGLVDRIT